MPKFKVNEKELSRLFYFNMYKVFNMYKCHLHNFIVLFNKYLNEQTHLCLTPATNISPSSLNSKWHCLGHIPKIKDNDDQSWISCVHLGFSPPFLSFLSCFLPYNSTLPYARSEVSLVPLPHRYWLRSISDILVRVFHFPIYLGKYRVAILT